MRMKPIHLALALLLSACGGDNAPKEKGPPPEPAANVQTGQKLATEVCAACHGEQGISQQEGTPHLAGQHAAYLRSALQAYKAGKRQSDAMSGIVEKLSDQDIIDVAAYYAGLPPFDGDRNPARADSVPAVANPIEQGQQAAAACGGCHGADGHSAMAGTPHLAALSQDYLAKAIQAYKDGSRQHQIMAGMVASLDDKTIGQIAAYYASLPLKGTGKADKGDAAQGKAKSEACAGCHGADGNPGDPKNNPALSAQDAQYLASAIRAYKNGSRKDEVMPGIVANLSDADIDNLAAYFTGQERAAPPPVARPMGAKEWAERCDRCHGPNGTSQVAKQFPRLAGQRVEYLQQALHQYHEGKRKHSTMERMVFPITDAEIEAVAAWYSRQK